MKTKKVLGIDPGLSGSLVVTDGVTHFQWWPMPIRTLGKEKSITFQSVINLLKLIREEHGRIHVYLERAVPFAMGAKSAFNYGRGFETVFTAVGIMRMPLTLVEPAKWTKLMHEGIRADLKPKARSIIAAERLYPQIMPKLPKKSTGAYHDGPVDALLISGYGLRRGAPISDLNEKGGF